MFINLLLYHNYFDQVFALGNKTYEHYNATGKFVDKKLEELGAERVFELGLGDDDAKLVSFLHSYLHVRCVTFFKRGFAFDFNEVIILISY